MSTPPETAAPRRRGPVPRISADKIADAVLTIGFDKSSVTAVAEQLGVTHAALYRYIGDRDGMMRAALVLATSRWKWPELVDDWREVCWNESRSWWAFCQQHPGFVAVLATTPGMPLPMSQRTMRVAVHLQRCGLAARDALMVVDLLVDAIHDIFHRSQQREGVIDQAIHMPEEEAAAHLAGVPDDMVEVVISALIGDPWPWFAAKLELVIDGLAARNPDA